MVRNTISIYLPRLISRHTYGSRHVISCAHAYPHTHRIQNTWRLEGPATAYTCDRAGFRIFAGDRTPIRAVAIRGACLCIATTPLRADRDVVAAAVQQAGGPPHAWPAVHADSQVGTPSPPNPNPSTAVTHRLAGCGLCARPPQTHPPAHPTGFRSPPSPPSLLLHRPFRTPPRPSRPPSSALCSPPLTNPLLPPLPAPRKRGAARPAAEEIWPLRT